MDVTGLQWFKIYEDGLTVSDQTWAVDRLIANKGKVTFQIPSCIESGQYLLRHEIIGELRMPSGGRRESLTVCPSVNSASRGVQLPRCAVLYGVGSNQHHGRLWVQESRDCAIPGCVPRHRPW